MHTLHKRPAFLLLLLWLACLSVCAVAAWLALQQPWLGVTLRPDGSRIRIEADTMNLIPREAELRRLVTRDGRTFELQASDLPESGEQFASYSDQARFFARQNALDAMLKAGEIQLIWLDATGKEQTTLIALQVRGIASLPGVFWFQLFIVGASFMIGCWIWLLRPHDWGARMFAATGVMLFVAGIAAALYGSRELAWSSAWMRGFETVNLLAVYLFGCALIALFLSYPHQIAAPRRLLWLPAVYLPWYALDRLQWLPNPEWGVNIPMLSQLLLTFAAAGIQWRSTRGRPLERAALRWFLLSVLVSCSLFTLSYVVPPLLGIPFLLPPGYDFGFFLIMYAGIALGLGRYRLFDMDEWAYRVLLWVGGATSVIALDALLIFIGLSQFASLGVSLLVSGWLYFPLRQWLWQRIVSRRLPHFESLLPELSIIAFAPVGELQPRWKALLQHLFDPLELLPAQQDGSGLQEEGLSMLIPACGELPAYRLRLAGRGQRLFSSQDAVFAASLSQALGQLMSGRNSYAEGASQERQRIYRDLHDDMGAKLLGLAISAQRANLPKEADLARSALQDLRDVVSRSTHSATPLADLLADWRMEAQQRAQAAGVSLEWRFPDREHNLLLTPETALNLTRILREAISNVLRHAQASHLRITTGLDEHVFTLSVEDDGIGLPAEAAPHRGMSSMQARATALNATLDWQAVEPHGCRMMLSVPLAALTP